MAEWGLRFWLMVTLSSEDGAEWRYDSETGEISATIRGQEIVVLGERPPLLATFHSDVAGLRQEYETHGYFYLESRGERGRFAALRYHLEEMPAFGFSAAVAGTRGQALARAKSALAKPEASLASCHGGAFDCALRAVWSVMSWIRFRDRNDRRH